MAESGAAAVWVDVADLKPWAQNPRDNAKAVAEVAKSIRRFGWGSPIVANQRDGEIIAGHTRFAAATKLGLKQVPVRWLDLDPADAHALALADNKVGEIADWNNDTLRQVLADLKAADESLLADTGFSDEELAALLGDVTPTVLEPEGEAPEVDESGPVHSAPGEVYQLGPHRLMCGDSTSVDAVETLMAGEKAQFCFTSPPYNSNQKFNRWNAKDPAFKGRGFYQDGYADDLKPDDYIDFNRAIFTNLSIVAAPEFTCCYNINYNKNSPSLYLDVALAGRESFPLVETIIWEKAMAVSLHGNNLTRIVEFIFVYAKGELKMNKETDACERNLWKVNNIGANHEIHKACFPVELVQKSIELFAPENGIVIEPFGGSGTTLIACAQTKRVARLMELDPRYCDVIRRRWTRWAKANNVDAGTGALDG